MNLERGRIPLGFSSGVLITMGIALVLLWQMFLVWNHPMFIVGIR
jgi:hypothetical protein